MKNIKWCHVNVEMFYADVFVFAGSRHDMMESGAAYLTSLAGEKGYNEDDVNSIGKALAQRLPGPNEKDNGGDVVLVHAKTGLVCFVRIAKFEPTVLDEAILSHECLHAALTIRDELQISEKRNHECLCYLHEYIYKKSLEEMIKPLKDQLPFKDLYVMRGVLEDIRRSLSEKKKSSPSRVTAHEEAILRRAVTALEYCDK